MQQRTVDLLQQLDIAHIQDNSHNSVLQQLQFPPVLDQPELDHNIAVVAAFLLPMLAEVVDKPF